MISQAEFGTTPNNAVTKTKSAMAENTKYDGLGGLKISEAQNKFSPNSHMPLPKPGFSD